MKKKLLLSIAVLGLTVGGAFAQTFTVGKIGFENVTSENIADAHFNTNCEEDAYDGAFNLVFDATETSYLPNTSNDDTTGTTISGEEVTTADGLKLSKSYYFDPINQTVRITVKVNNPTASNVTSFPLILSAGLGSDGSTQIDTTFSGGSLNAVPTDADRWVISSDGNSDPLTYCYDPILTWIRYSPAAAVKPKYRDVLGDGNDYFEDSINFSVPAGETRYFLYFSRLDSTLAAAKANLSKYQSIQSMYWAGYFAGIPASDYTKYVNFDLQLITTAVSEVTEISNNITLYPNPASGASSVNVKINNNMSGNVSLRLLDARGLQVKTVNVAKSNGAEEFSLNLEGLQQGVYTLQVTQGSNVGHKLLTVY